MFSKSVSRLFSVVKHSKSSEEIKQFLSPKDNKLAIAWFSAGWCGPCKAVAKSIENLAESNKDSLVVVKVDIDEAPDVAQAFNVTSVPTFHFLKSGQSLDTVIGASAEKVKALIEKHK